MIAYPVQPFYSPISAGSMAHVGPIPQSNVTFNTVHPVPVIGQPIMSPLQPITNPRQPIRVVPRTPLAPIQHVPGGQYPVTYQPVNIPRPAPPSGSRPPNWVNFAHV